MPNYPSGATARAERDELFAMLVARDLDFSVEQQFPEPIGGGYPNRRLRIRVETSLDLHKLQRLVGWASREGMPVPGRRLEVDRDGGLWLGYEWLQ